ncbi:alkaline-phosphatase-like protein [Xylaria bambusicola]|uniref:alkaline-phosphatase-like protein n=1 Tax=Xylaria bambusicola TaxID=326684 RepID=UPI002007A018|nr:alkaline-phosphatase-like protein [Xylaria bambusicola]KAI0514418.1 alkaline-phosphatase-like protein [Xylaria bambusicola]
MGFTKTLLIGLSAGLSLNLGFGFARADQLPLVDKTRPNVVFVLTDDQDLHLDSLQYMPFVRKHLIEKGTSFNKHYCTTALCCPSRVTLWTGRVPHNTNVTDVSPPYGGYPKFVNQSLNDNYFPVWLQQAGYNNYYTGKLFNAHTVLNYNDPYPRGYTGSDFLLDPFTYEFLNSTFQRNQEAPRSYEGEYSTDVMAEKAYGFLDDAVRDLENSPFFLTVAPIGPHANVHTTVYSETNKTSVFTEPIPAKRHEHLFKDVKVPRTKNFNPDQPSGANWLLDLPQQNQSNIDYNDHFYRQRLRSLQAVDELVDGLFTRLEEYGILENTYFVYSSDNGYHIGQHRLQPGKACGYEEDINVPLIIRGPGIAENQETNIVTSHTDLAPTFLELLGIPLRDDFDGRPIPLTAEGLKRPENSRREHVNVEFWGGAIGEGIYEPQVHPNHTYKAVRLSSPEYSLYYSVWCNNEHELYDMTVDPGQLHNLLAADGSPLEGEALIAGRSVSSVVSRLDALLFVLKSCKGDTCREPWKQLHPAGNVETLADALRTGYDEFYAEQTGVNFEYCAAGYIIDAEGPMWETDSLMTRDGAPWYEWV